MLHQMLCIWRKIHTFALHPILMFPAHCMAKNCVIIVQFDYCRALTVMISFQFLQLNMMSHV